MYCPYISEPLFILRLNVERRESYVNWTVHHLDSWIKRDQLDVACFIISLFNDQHVSDVNTPILRSLRLICWVISWVVFLWFDVSWCYVVVWLGWCGIRMQAEALGLQPASGYHTTPAKPQRNTNTHRTRAIQLMKQQQISSKLLRMGVLTSETCWALNNEIIKQVTWSWSLFIQLVERRILIWHWANSSRIATVLNLFSTLIYNPSYGRNTPYQPVHNHIFRPSWSFTFEPEFACLWL